MFGIIVSRTKPMGVIVALNERETANGALFWDDGDALGMNILIRLTCVNTFALSEIVRENRWKKYR